MSQMKLPIFIESYALYKMIYRFRMSVPRLDRYGLWLRIENIALDFIELIIQAEAQYELEKLHALNNASLKLNLIRFLVRIACDTKSINSEKYNLLQQQMDVIGRMLGAWIKSIKNKHNIKAS
ncbi:MAG: four helix bundle protein [Patescibacteria group bacterium]